MAERNGETSGHSCPWGIPRCGSDQFLRRLGRRFCWRCIESRAGKVTPSAPASEPDDEVAA